MRASERSQAMMQSALLPEPPDSLLVGMESVEVEMVEKESIC